MLFEVTDDNMRDFSVSNQTRQSHEVEKLAEKTMRSERREHQPTFFSSKKGIPFFEGQKCQQIGRPLKISTNNFSAQILKTA